MPVESSLFVVGVVTLFVLFMAALAWGERQTRGVPANSPAAIRPAE